MFIIIYSSTRLEEKIKYERQKKGGAVSIGWTILETKIFFMPQRARN